ncbi:cytochrome P450 [Prauserella shujinwangii]|uniref:Cytochrome P450 n=1 Tax=Prauserella shujinwangii TaxID=1453103 RepID=A0A2T0LL85_9PSEU|nr:cytochrome P450 [Prauserella shujinwangii]PRX43717.1 cytochrome P450 [Prauserella shujinwangii]
MNTTELRHALRTLPFLDACARAPGEYVELSGPPSPKLLVWQPDAVDWIFRSDQALGHPGSRSLIPLLGRSSLLWGDGERHAAYRRVLGPPLRGRKLSRYHDVIASTVHDAIDALRPGTVLPLSAWTRGVALRIIGRIILGPGENGAHTVDAVLARFAAWIERALGSRSRTLAYRFLRGRLPPSGPELDRLFTTTARAAARAHPHTLAGLLLDDAGPLAGMRDAELRDQVASLLFAGHETTASATAWAVYWLDREPAVRHDVLAELAATSDDGADSTRVPLLHAVLQESLRITPPVPAAGNRVLREDTELLGRTLPAGTTLAPSIYLAHRRPERFPSPARFDPGRFLGGRVEARHYFPFGGGDRHCLGSQLSQLEARMIVAALLRRRTLRCADPGAGVPQLRGHAMAPASRLRMVVTACHD